MMSIRSRLSLAIVLVTAVLATGAVWSGLRLLERDVRSDAIDRHQADLFGEVADISFAVGGFATVEADPVDAFAIGTSAFLLNTIEAVDAIDLLDPIIDDFASDDELYVLSYSGGIVAVDVEQGSVRTVDMAEIDDDDVVVLEDDLIGLLAFSELFALTGDVIVAGAILSEDGVVVETASEVTPDIETADLAQSDDRIIETAVVTSLGPDIGLIVDVTEELSAIDSLRAPLWTAAIAVVLLAGIATWLLTGRALRPVQAITSRVEQISGGTLHGRVPEPGTHDEIGTLAATMNQMLGRLEASDRAQRQFVSDASHELRTPVSVLRSEADAATSAPDSTSIDRLASVVAAEADRLGALIDDLLVLARTDETTTARGVEGSSASTVNEIDLDDIVLAESARTRRVPIDRAEVSAGRVRGRANELARVVAHLLDNAARHADKRVAVSVSSHDGFVRLCVDDDGDGIDEANRARIFERFVRLDEARTRDDGGSGLGLAVVAAIVDQHAGTITVDTSPLGGARFEVRLPEASS